MRGFLTTLFFLISFVCFGQNNENAQKVSELTNITYVDLDNDIISSSNISLGYLGDISIFSYTLVYEWGGEKHNNSIFFSHTPTFEYRKLGYNYSKTKEFESGVIRTNNYSLTISESGYGDAITIAPFFNQMYEFNNNRVGYTLFVNDYSWNGFDFMGEYYPAAAETKFSVMIIGMKRFEKGKWIIKPELFLLSGIRTHYITLEDIDNPLDIWYWDYFNINAYYGTSLEYMFTDKFGLGTKFRSNLSYSSFDSSEGFSKSIPVILTLGCNYDF